MPNKLKHHNIRSSGTVHRNLSSDLLMSKLLSRKEATLTKKKVPVVYSGIYTGRSPNDRFIVETKTTRKDVRWGKVNMPISEENFEKLYKMMTDHLSSLAELFIFDGFVGADKDHQLHVRVISESAFQSLFSHHALRRPTDQELKNHKPQLTVLAAPNLIANPKKHGTNSEAFILLNMDKMIVLIGSSKYCGEIKKAIFTVMNYVYPKRGVFPMHCSANVGKDGDTALFFGLSGTGKTTLSADPKRFLIGDDEHGWSENGIFNFEGGCYAKCIDLKRESEPQIWDAIRDHALVENVELTEDGEINFAGRKFTENTRVAYPLHYIENAVLSGVGDHPKNVIFLTADAFGIMPPVARLDDYGAMYHFMSGYTAKLAGTERGIKSPAATFSTCFGAPFMPLHPYVYAELLKKYMDKYKVRVYLINTGWSGGAYGVGHRISIKDTRAIVDAVLEGKLDKVKYRRDPNFNFQVPKQVPGVDSRILNPRNLWKNPQDYDNKAKELVNLFVENFKQFKNVPKKVIDAGPS